MPLLNFLSVFTGGGLVSFLVAIVIIAIVIYAVKVLLDWLTLPQPIKTLIWLVVAVVVILWLLNKFGGVSI